MTRSLRLAVACSALALVACKGGQDEAARPTPGGEATKAGSSGSGGARKDKDVRVFHRTLGEPEYLDPGLISESEGGIVSHDTFEGLFTYGPTHKEWRPGVAETMEASEDGRTLTFKLRTNAKWSDGTPVTAHDFEYAWKRVLDPKTGSRYVEILAPIEGAKEYTQSGDADDRAALREKVGVKALDDHTLQVRLVAPTPYFKQLTAFYTYSPVPRHVVEKHGDQWARPGNLVSNGPWVVSEWRSKQHIIAVKNPHYWDTATLPFDKIVYHISETNEPAYNKYEANELDFIESKVPESVLPRLIKERNKELQVNQYLGVYFYMFNTKRKPFDDVRVRQALNLAVNKEEIGKFVVKGNQEAAPTIVHPALKELGYEGPGGPEFDPDKARALLAEAGFPGGKGFPRFQITYNTLEGHKLIAEFVQQQWKKNLGIDCDLNNMEWKVLLKKQHEKDFEVSRSSWIGDFLDPLTFLDLWEGQNPNNRTQWDHPKFNELIAKARVEPDPAARMAHLREAEALFVAELPAMPMYFYMKYDLVKPWLKGYHGHLQGIHMARYFKVEP